MIVVLIMVSSAMAMLEVSWPEQGDGLKTFLKIAGYAISGLFLGELSLRCWTYRKRSRFFARYWLDIVASLPVPFEALRFLRLLRLLRLLRVGTMLRRRYAAGSGGEFIVIFIISGVVVFVAASVMAAFESSVSGQGKYKEFEYSFWWSLLSLVSNQPADNVPVTTAGRIISLVITLTGLCLFAIVTGTAAAVMSQRLRRLEANPMDLEELEDHIIICGWDRRAPLVIEELQHSAEEKHRAIVVIGELEELPPLNWKIVNRDLIYLVKGDFTNAELLEKAGIRRAAKAIIVSDKGRNRSDQDRDARTILAALTIEKLNKEIYTCAELLNREHEAHLRMAGVEDVVCTSEYGATLLSSMAIHSGISTIIGELLSVQYGNEFFKIACPAWLEGKTFAEGIAAFTKKDAILIALDRPIGGKRHEVTLNPEKDFKLQKADLLVVISRLRPDITAP
ncbi:MAG: potassium channel [Planctomycetota bacterium]|nr:MAG: potassium channel [Planctomycetota bacterium]